MIVTGKKHVPTRWIVFAVLPWAAITYKGGIIGVAFLFSLKRFVENPAGVTFILSLPGLLSMFISPLSGLISDRVWTPVGRRKPFIIVSWVVSIASLVAMPLVPNLWLLLTAYILFGVAGSLNVPMEPLKQEIVPPSQRGLATGLMSWLSNLATMTFYFVMLGHFDDVTFAGGLPLSGDKVIYWSGALLLAAMLSIIVLGIRETNPHSPLQGQRLSWRNLLGGLLDREMRPVYVLVLATSCVNFYGGLGALSNLLYTDQWGYTKQEMGVNVAAGGLINVFVIGLLTVFADRLNRMRAFQTTLFLIFVANAAYYCYVTFVLPDHRPTLVEIIVFGEAISIIAYLNGLLFTPLVYDYVRRDKMGTYNAGASLVQRLAGTIILNAVGLFVWGYASFFQPPAGEMARVVLREETDRPHLLARLTERHDAGSPSGGSPFASGALFADVWQATGVTDSHGRTWEIRQRDKESEGLAADKTQFETRRDALTVEAQTARDRASANRGRGSVGEAETAEHTAQEKQTEIERTTQQITGLETQLTSRANAFRDRVSAVLGGELTADGDQILSAQIRSAVLITLFTTRAADDRTAGKLLNALRASFPETLDLHPAMHEGRFVLAASALVLPGEEADATGRALLSAVMQAERQLAPALFSESIDVPMPAPRKMDALTLELATVEEPVATYLSPITRVVGALLAPFTDVSSPNYRLTNISRNLTSADEASQARVQTGPTPRSLSVTVLLSAAGIEGNPPPEDAANRRLAALLNDAGEDVRRQARTLYGRIETVAAAQRITLARPLLASGYAPLRYDYMSGYLMMFVLSCLGVALTFVFVRMEKRGVVRKYGVEEAAAS